MKLEIGRYDFGRVVSRFGWLDSARKNGTGFVVDMTWEFLEGSDLTFDELQGSVASLDVYESVEEFADDRLNGQEADELLEDAGSKALLEIALDRLVDRGTILAYNLHDGDATIICDL